MKIARMIIGIVSIVLSLLVSLQSCAAGAVNAIEQNGGSDGSAGLFLSFCMLVAGIIGIATRKSKGGSITAGFFYLFGALIAIPNIGVFKDLGVWAFLCLVFAAVFIIGGFAQKKPKKEDD